MIKPAIKRLSTKATKINHEKQSYHKEIYIKKSYKNIRKSIETGISKPEPRTATLKTNMKINKQLPAKNKREKKANIR